MRLSTTAALVVVSACLLHPTLATGQAGLFRRDGEPRSRQAEIYEMNVRRGINATLTEWREAWQRDDADGLARLYAEDATLFTDTETAHGRDAIADYFRRTLPGVTRRQTLPLHFDASGMLAYQVDQVTVTLEGDDGPRREFREVIVLRQQWDNRWLIESQLSSAMDPAR
jgi:uncharacterized protein (TIGR02246 family)